MKDSCQLNKIFVLLFIGLFFFDSSFSFAQKVKKTESGLQYFFYKKNRSNRRTIKGDIVFYQLILKNADDSVVLNTRKEFGEQQITASASSFKGDLMEALTMLHIGDSAVFYIPVDSLYKNSLPYFAKSKTCMRFYLAVSNIMNEKEFNENQIKMKQQSLDYDDSVLHVYLNKIFCVPEKLASGIYIYQADKERCKNNRDIKLGDTIKVNYTGRLLNGYIFDSNTEKRFNHVEPFKFVVGKGEVIKGWDESFMHLKYGAKAILFIPSSLAYGKKQVGTIPSNSILIFEVEVIK